MPGDAARHGRPDGPRGRRATPETSDAAGAALPEEMGWRMRAVDPDDERGPELDAITGDVFGDDLALAPGDLAGRLLASHIVDTDDADDLLDLYEVTRVVDTRDGRIVHLPSLLEGRVLTHRLQAEEVDEARVSTYPDAGLLVTLLPGLRVAGGGPVVEQDRIDADGIPHDASLFGPPGWLPGHVAAGDLIALHVTNGELKVRRTGPTDPTTDRATADALSRTFSDLSGRNALGGPIDVPELLTETIVRYPEAFRRPTAPLTVLLADIGLIHVDGGVFDLDHAEPMALLSSVSGLTGGPAKAVLLLLDTLDDTPDPPGSLVAAATTLLTIDDTVTEAIADAVLSGDVAPSAIGRLVTLLDGTVDGRTAATLAFLDARRAEALGQLDAAEQALHRALEADPAFAPAHADLACFAEDRNDVAAALHHLRCAGVDEQDPVYRDLNARLDAPPAADHTAGWLVAKAARLLSSAPHRSDFLTLAGDATFNGIAGDVFVDAALFDGGGLRAFLDQRGVLLPERERELATHWLTTQRALFLVRGVHEGGALTVHDMASHEVLTVNGAHVCDAIAPGDALLGRVLPDHAGGHLLFGANAIPADRLDHVRDLLARGDHPRAFVRALAEVLAAGN